MINFDISARFACVVLFDKNDRVLLLQRYNTSCFDGQWALPGGRIEEHESYAQAALREAHEELGVIICEEDLTLRHIITLYQAGKYHKGYYFTVKKWHGVPGIQKPNKCSGVSWFSSTALPKMIIPASQHVIECDGYCPEDFIF